MVARAMFWLCVLAMAGAAAASDRPARPNGKNPDRIVCKTVGESGSRLRRARICHTMNEWAERRRQTQQAIDKIQTNRPSEG